MSSVEVGGETNEEDLDPNVAAVALVLSIEQLLMILMTKRRYLKDKKYLYTMPGGLIEPGETIQQGGARELWEETGLEVRPRDLKKVGPPLVIHSSVRIQYLYCHLESSAPWQSVQNTEPEKLEPWEWMDLVRFKELSRLGVYPDLDLTGHVGKIVQMTKGKVSLFDSYSHGNTWLDWIHVKDLRRMYGLK